MKHLDDITAIALAEGQIDEEARTHVGLCDRCRQQVTVFRRVVEALAATSAAPAPPERLQRWARAYANSCSTSRPRWSVLSFLTRGTEMVAAVRGGHLPGVALLFGDEHHHIDIRIDPGADHGARIHGQIVPLTDSGPKTWDVTAVATSGATFTTATDPSGEFWLEGVDQWQNLSMVATSADQRLVVPRLNANRDTSSEA